MKSPDVLFVPHNRVKSQRQVLKSRANLLPRDTKSIQFHARHSGLDAEIL